VYVTTSARTPRSRISDTRPRACCSTVASPSFLIARAPAERSEVKEMTFGVTPCDCISRINNSPRASASPALYPACGLEAEYEHAEIKVLKEIISGITPRAFICCSSSSPLSTMTSPCV
jgi:hypothetical protein